MAGAAPSGHPAGTSHSPFGIVVITELAVVSSLVLTTLGFAATLARRVVGVSASTAEARHLMSATQRAADGFFRREIRACVVPLLVTVALVSGAQGALLARSTDAGAWGSLVWAAIGTLLGAAMTLGASYAAARLGLASTITTVRAAHVSLDHGATTALAGAGAAALTADAIGLSSLVGVSGLLYLLGGGGTLAAPEDGRALLQQATAVLPGVAAGTVVVALVLASGGAAYRIAAQCAARLPPFLDAGDPRNPAMVAAAVGEHVGATMRRTAEMMAATTLATTALVLLGVTALAEDVAALGDRAWALVSLPFVARGVGLTATAVGLLAAHVREGERAALALWRGQAATAILAIGGLGGASMWLLGRDYATTVTLAAAAGVVGALGASQLSLRHTDRRLDALQGTLGLERFGPALVITRGLAVGLAAAFVPVLVLAGTALASGQLGARSGVEHGAFFAGVATLAGAAASSGFVLALGLLGPIAEGATVLSGFEPEATRADPKRRAASLDEAAFEGASVSDSYFVALCASGALLSATLLGVTGESPTGRLPTAMLVACGALGSALVTLLVGHTLASAARSGAAAATEVERQLKGLPREDGRIVVPGGFTPSYRAVVDLTGRLAAQGLALPAASAVLAPVALGIGLRLLYKSPGPATEGVTAFVGLAAATGLGVAFAGAGARVVLGAAHRASRLRGASAAFEASQAGHSVGELLGTVAAPVVHLLAAAAAVAALVVASALARL